MKSVKLDDEVYFKLRQKQLDTQRNTGEFFTLSEIVAGLLEADALK